MGSTARAAAKLPMLPPQKMTMRDLAPDDLLEFIRYSIDEFKNFSNISLK
jgi:hypothetical protein